MQSQSEYTVCEKNDILASGGRDETGFGASDHFIILEN